MRVGSVCVSYGGADKKRIYIPRQCDAKSCVGTETHALRNRETECCARNSQRTAFEVN